MRLPSGKLKRIRKLYFTKAAAEKAIRRDKVKAETGEYNSPVKITLKDWKDKIVKFTKAHRKGTTINAYDSILSMFNLIVGEGRKLESIDRSDLRRFVEYLKTKKKNDSTIKTYLSKVLAALNLAPQIFEELILWQPPKFRYEGYTKSRERVLESVEIIALLQKLDTDFQDIILCALNTGGRLREVLSLRWDCVFFDAPGYTYGALRLRVTKVRGIKEDYRVIPATKEVIEILQRRKADNGKSPYVFPSPKNKNQYRTEIRKTLKTACESAKIIYGRDVRGGFVFHDLRRTSVTYLRRAGIDIENVCSITGHSPIVMLKVYSKTNVESQQRAVDALANLIPYGQFKESGQNLEN